MTTQGSTQISSSPARSASLISNSHTQGALARRARDAVDVADLRIGALRYLPNFITAFVETGGGNGDTLRRNMEAYAEYRLRTRSLVDLSQLTSETQLFDRAYAMPVGISAIGNLGLFRPHADEMLAEVAKEMNLPFMLSGMSTSPIEQVVRRAPAHVWYQLYASHDNRITQDLIRRARDVGVEVLVVTVDFPVRLRNASALRTGVSFTGGANWKGNGASIAWDLLRHWRWSLAFVRGGGLPALGGWAPYAPQGAKPVDIARFVGTVWPHNLLWHEIEAIRKVWPGKLILKGLCHIVEIQRAQTLGVDAIIVSNHGGNKLDSMHATLDMLVEARPAVGLPLLLDGGIRTGSDVFKAVALGARFCFVGRAALYAIAAAGQAGAERLCQILGEELHYTQAMTGCPNLRSIPADVVSFAGVHSTSRSHQ